MPERPALGHIGAEAAGLAVDPPAEDLAGEPLAEVARTDQRAAQRLEELRLLGPHLQREVVDPLLREHVLRRPVGLGLRHGPFEQHIGDPVVRVLAEVPPDEVAAVADPGRDLPPGVQQETGVLEAAHAQAIGARADREPGVARPVRAEVCAHHRREIVRQLEIDEVRVDRQHDPVRCLEVGAVARAEVDVAVAVADAPEAVAGLVDGLVGKHRRRRELEDLVGARGEGIEIRLRDRPAVERADPRRLEVGVIELAAPPAPVVRAAAETAHPADEGVVVVEADHVAAVEILRIGRGLEPARLHQRHAAPCFRECKGEGDPGWSSAGDADVENLVESRPVRQIRIGQHGAHHSTGLRLSYHSDLLLFRKLRLQRDNICPCFARWLRVRCFGRFPGDQPSISSAIRTITRAWRAEAMSMSRPL